jgi:hypothetical protein
METLTQEDRLFFNYLRVKGKREKINGYIVYRDLNTKKKYKRSRILFQIFHNVKLNPFEIIHHKDKNKENDNIKNLELTTQEEHTTKHHAGQKYKARKKF